MTQKLKTSIHKIFSTGFALNEGDLRRMHQLMIDAAAKLHDAKEKLLVYVRTENGTIYEFDIIDEIFSLENIGEKSIDFLFVSIGNIERGENADESNKESDWMIRIRFQKLSSKQYLHTPTIQLEVVGPTRDWVVLTAAELEERIKRTQNFSPTRYLSHSATPFVAMFLMLALLTGVLIVAPTPEPIHHTLENLRASGQIKDAIDAVIAAERLKQPNTANREGLFVWAVGGLIGIAVAISLLPRLAKLIGRPYEFLWGEYVAAHQRRKGIESTIWIVVVLGIVVGIASTWVSKKIGL